MNLKKVNAATVRDHYPLPIIDHVLERVAGKEAYSFLDGFLGYNQVSIDAKDQHKTTFATEWGIFAYKSYAIWFNKCSCNILETHESCFQRVSAGILGNIYG